MIAVIETGGKQYIVKKWDEILVDRLDTDKKTITFAPLLISDEEGKDTKIGTPTLSGAKVSCKILGEQRGEKVKVFKMKAKKRYARTRWFRASLTKLEVTSITATASSASTEKKATTTKKTATKSTAKSTTTKKTPAKKTTTTKKSS